MAVEDLTTYTDYDPEDYIDIPSAYRADFTLRWGASAGRLSYDFGAGYFAGDMEHQFEHWPTIDHYEYGYGGWTTLFMLTNILGRANQVADAIGIAAINYPNSHSNQFFLFEVYDGTVYLEAVGSGLGVPWTHRRLARSGNTLTLTSYTDGTYTVVSSTASLTLHGTSAYRYVQIGGGRSDGLWGTMVTGRVQNVVLSLVKAPTVTIDPTTDVEEETAVGNGNITDKGGEDCDKRGICWNTSGNPTVEDDKSEETDPFGTGPFSRPITGLSPGTKYYAKAYAHNSAGYGYSSEESFTTKPNIWSDDYAEDNTWTLIGSPAVTTGEATGLAAVLAALNGTLDDDGGEACDCGFEWGLDTDYGVTTPTESKTAVNTFSQVIGGLFPNTTYHFRALATNSAGTGRGDDMSFTTALVISRAFALAREEL